jgi:hypothetical protein
MATGTIIPSPVFTGLDANGDPVSGGKLYTYVAGTTTPQTTYSDVGLTSANANPIVLDSSGRATVYVTTGSSFKYVLKTSADVTLWTADNIGAVPKSTATVDITVTAGEAITALDAAYISQGDGGKTAGRAYKTDADNDYASTLAVVVGLAPSAIASGETGSLRISGALGGYTGLTGGAKQYASATAGELTESAPSNAKIVGQASSTTTVAITAAVSTIDASQIVSGTLAVARGGTGIASYSTNDFLRASGSTTLAATAANAVFPYISPLTTRGDMLVGTSGVVTGTRLAAGGANTYLKSDGTDLSWAALSVNNTRTIILPITAAELDTSTPPTAVIAANRMHLAFNDSSNQLVYYMFTMPPDYGSALKMVVCQAADTATSGTVAWKSNFFCLTSGDSTDVNSPSWSSANTLAFAVSGTAGYMTSGELTITNTDSLVAGDLVTFRFYRDSGSGSDTVSGTAELYGLSLTYTAS